MNTIQIIAKNTGVLLASNIICYILNFLFLMYIARYLGVDLFGVLSFALAFTAIFSVLADFGLGTLTVREIAKDKSLLQKFLGNIILIKIILVVIAFGFIVLFINLLGYSELTIIVVYFISLYVVFNAIGGIFNSIFQAYEKMEFISIGNILRSVLMLLGGLFVIFQDLSVVEFAFLYFIVSVIVFGYGFLIFILKFKKSKIEIDLSFWKKILKDAWPMGGMAICIMIYFRIDTVMLSLMKGDTAVGLYNAAYRLSEISTVIPAIFMTSMFPVLSRFHKKSKDSFIIAYGKSIKYLFYLALPMAMVVTLLSKPIINLIFGAEFSGSIVALQILIWAAAIMYVSMVQGNTIISANKQIFCFKVTVFSAILNIILNLILIPRYSYIGASATTVATECFGFFIGIFFLFRWGYRIDINNIYLAPLFGLGIAGIISIILIQINVNILITSLVFILIYASILYKIGIKEDDKELIKKVINISKFKS